MSTRRSVVLNLPLKKDSLVLMHYHLLNIKRHLSIEMFIKLIVISIEKDHENMLVSLILQRSKLEFL